MTFSLQNITSNYVGTINTILIIVEIVILIIFTLEILISIYAYGFKVPFIFKKTSIKYIFISHKHKVLFQR